MRLRLAIIAIYKPSCRGSPSSFQTDDALGVITAVLLDPHKTAIGVGRLVGRELVGAGFGAGFVEIYFILVFRRYRRRENGRRLALAALVAAEIDPLAAAQLAFDFCFQIFHRTYRRRQYPLLGRSNRCRRSL